MFFSYVLWIVVAKKDNIYFIFLHVATKGVLIASKIKLFYQRYPYLNIRELIEFYSVFDGLFDTKIVPDDGLINNIQRVYLENFDTVQKYFIYSDKIKLHNEIDKTLSKLAHGDRKRFSIYKKNTVSQNLGKKIYKILFDKGVIRQEISRERPLKIPKKFLKKELRNYIVEDKIHFCHEAVRFFYTFIAPYKEEIMCGQYEKVLENIQRHFDKYVSLTFEVLSEELLGAILPENSVLSSGSYWEKSYEIDLLVYTKDGRIIAGEAKWKNRKICKNVINSLKKKSLHANLHVTHFAFFSKSGFSKEVIATKEDNMMLFGLDDFERLYR